MGQIRIIGGRWRGRKIQVPALPDLRPTPDRVRETLFNWLAPMIHGATCLDLFAGSGILGLEALSRGAEKVVFVEKTEAAFKALRLHLDALGSTHAQIHQGDALALLPQFHEQFDLIFLDPPYQSNLLSESLNALGRLNLLKPSSYVYLESNEQTEISNLEHWNIIRQKRAGQVNYQLMQLNRSDLDRGKQHEWG